jgi:hypothetical protein
MNFEIWKESNSKDLYNLYKILLEEVEKFNQKIERLDRKGDYNFRNNLDLDYIESNKFINKFLHFLYDNNFKEIN